MVLHPESEDILLKCAHFLPTFTPSKACLMFQSKSQVGVDYKVWFVVGIWVSGG